MSGEKRHAPARRANELDGRTWTRHSISIWSDLKKTPEEMALGHPAMSLEALPARLIDCLAAATDVTNTTTSAPSAAPRCSASTARTNTS